MTVNHWTGPSILNGTLLLGALSLFSLGCSDDAASGGTPAKVPDAAAAMVDAFIPPNVGDEPDSGCDEAAAEAYENLVLGENCPGECCVEQAGDITERDGPLDALKTPTIHSAYNDLPSRTKKSDIPAAQEQLRFYVPVAKHRLEGVLEETAVACITDADCVSISGDLSIMCARRDPNGDGVTYSAGGMTEYAPCLDAESCYVSGGRDGDLADQSAVPDSMVGERCDGALTDVGLPVEGECASVTSLCVHGPSWKPRPTGEVMNAGHRVILQGVNMIDTEMSAYLVRVAEPDGQTAPTGFKTLDTNPVDGELMVKLHNGATCVLEGREDGDCAEVDRQGRRVFARIENTLTKAAEPGSDAIAPVFHYLEQENQWFRYHPPAPEGATSRFDLVNLWDDLVLFELPENLSPGVYELRLGYSVNTWLDALYESRGSRVACAEKERMKEACTANVENPTFADQYCSDFAEDCTVDEIFYRLSEDRMALSNPVYINVSARPDSRRFNFKLVDVTPRRSGEHAIWDGDDIHLYTMFVKFDPAMVQAEDCAVTPDGMAPESDDCLVGGPYYFEDDNIHEDRTITLPADSFSMNLDVKPGEVVNVVTIMIDDDGNPEAVAQILDGSGDLTEGILAAVITAEVDGDTGAAAGAATGVLFDLVGGIIDDVTDAELLSFAVTRYNYDELIVLTHAAQLGLNSETLGALELPSLQGAPSRQIPLQGNTFTVDETVILPEVLSWGRHTETRRYNTTGNADFGDLSYRGRSRYDLGLSISHVRD